MSDEKCHLTFLAVALVKSVFKKSPSRSSVGRASDSQPAPGSNSGSRRFGARYIEPPDGDGLRSGQRPQSVEVSERGGPCPAMWAR